MDATLMLKSKAFYISLNGILCIESKKNRQFDNIVIMMAP